MTFDLLNLFLSSGASREVARLSAEAAVGSIITAAFVVVIPTASFLLWVSQKDQVSRSR